jgi:CRISPR-associated protein Cas8c/Csd1 subtype I-C
MIFPVLHRFAKIRGLLDDVDFVEQTIHCVLRLEQDGSLASVVPASDKENVMRARVAKLPARTSAAIACLGADTLNRVIPGFDPEANKFAQQTQSLFIGKLETVQATSPHAGVASVIRFLRSLQESDAIRAGLIAQLTEQKFKVSEWVSFQVNGIEDQAVMPEWPVLRDWWQGEQSKRRQESVDVDAMLPCIVTGKLCNPVRTHGTRIKVAPGGLPGGVALVSSDKAAFGSYGFEKSLVSPMSEEAVEGYIRAINWLGGDSNSHYRTSDTNFLFFSDQPITERNPGKAIEFGEWVELLDEPPEPESPATPISARKVMEAPHAGQLDSAHAAESVRFYGLSLSGSSARGIVRGWIDEPLPVARTNVAHWFEDLTIQLDRPLFENKRQIASYAEFYHRWPLWQLVACFQGKGEAAKEQVAQQREQLWESALLGRKYPVPLALLVLAVSRIQAAGDVSPVRAALIRCILNRLPNRKESMKPELDINAQTAAFHCGRLLRLLQNIQTTALGDTNATVVSKYYAAASATPSSVFRLLLSKVQQHLNKIRGDKPGLAHYFDERLGDIAGRIVELGGFPRVNQPDAQGEFALGFYFQRLQTKKEKPEAEPDDTNENSKQD